MKIVKFSAMWCSGCLVMNPIWEKIKKIYPQIEFINYDYDVDEDMKEKYKIGNILPEVIIYKDDKEVTRIIGEKKQKEIIKIIDSL